jgi:hypothetical protein
MIEAPNRDNAFVQSDHFAPCFVNVEKIDRLRHHGEPILLTIDRVKYNRRPVSSRSDDVLAFTRRLH